MVDAVDDHTADDHTALRTQSLYRARHVHTERNGLPDALTTAEQGFFERLNMFSKMGGTRVDAQPFRGAMSSIASVVGEVSTSRTAPVSVAAAIGHFTESLDHHRLTADLSPDLSKRPKFTPSNGSGSDHNHG